MSRQSPFISLEDVRLRLSDGGLSHPIRWQILGNQQWAVIGPNASGKSTLMRALCGQAPVAGGEIVYHFASNGGTRNYSGLGTLPQDRISYADFDAQRRVLGFESPFHQARWNSWRPHDTLSVSEYLSERHVLRINPYQVVEELADPAMFLAQRARVIELLGIEALLDRNIVQVSNGERRKVLLARALLQSPDVLILDNPFTGLDVGYRSRLEAIIGTLMFEGLRVILVANAGETLPEGITHILWMEGHEVIAQGPKGVVLDGIAGRSSVTRRHQAENGTPSATEQKPGGRQAEGWVLVQMRDVSVSYNDVPVLSQINWTVRQGENWALLGPNGAGKTTLLSLILGDNPQAYANSITLFGRRRGSGESIWDIKRQIGWVAPELHLYYPGGIPCFDIVCSGFFDSIGRYERCTPRQKEIARSWMERLGIADHADSAFEAVSEGEQRLVLITRALVKDPTLLILDEPCQGLDANNRERVIQMVEAIGHNPNASIIYVTHQLDALPNAITHVLRLEEGRIAEEARTPGSAFK